jgi:hypothetical protein
MLSTCWQRQTSGYLYLRVAVNQIDVHSTGETWPTCHTYPTLYPRMTLDHTYLTRFTYSNLSWSHQQCWIGPQLPKKGSWPNPQHDSWPIHESIQSFSPKATIEVVGVKSPSVDGRLLGLPGPYLWHSISTFNTCSWESTHRSLTDTDEGYNPGGAGFWQLTPRPFQSTVLRFPPNGLIRSQVNHHQHKPLVIKMWNTYRLLTTRHLPISISMPSIC